MQPSRGLRPALLLTLALWLPDSAFAEAAGRDPRIALEAVPLDLDAQRYGARFEELLAKWRAAGHDLALLEKLDFESLRFLEPDSQRRQPWGIQSRLWDGTPRELDRRAFAKLLSELTRDGYRVLGSSWRQSEFGPLRDRFRSLFKLSLHVANERFSTRHVLELDLEIVWQKSGSGKAQPRVQTLRVVTAEHHVLTGAPPFVEGPRFTPEQPGSFADPIATSDLDADGDPDLIALGWNLVLKNEGGRFTPQKLLQAPPAKIGAAAVGDFNADGKLDLIVAAAGAPLAFFRGGPGQRFEEPAQPLLPSAPLVSPSVLTAGDIDADGDLDLWLGQYREATPDSPPEPYTDARDGHPSFLLLNAGNGRFEDITEAAGLAAARRRRVRSAALVDLDHDARLDLLLVSDFAGVELFHNEGGARFESFTEAWLGGSGVSPKLWGQTRALGDFNRDGRLDIFAGGVSSERALRLEAMRFLHGDWPDADKQAVLMGRGNQLYLRGSDRFGEASFRNRIAVTGWSQAATAEDFDRDGHTDLLVGTKSRESSPGHSALLMSLFGQDFLSLGFPLGVALGSDTRALLSDDLDRDGRVDLLLATGLPKNELIVLWNRWQGAGHWLGVRAAEASRGRAVGARVTVVTAAGSSAAHFVMAESQRSLVHVFGLGDATRVEYVETHWPGGTVSRVTAPPVDSYLEIAPPLRATAAIEPSPSERPQSGASTKFWLALVLASAGIAAAAAVRRRKH